MAEAKITVRKCKGPCKGANKLRAGKAQFCSPCYKARRAKQLRDGIAAYRKRAAAGKAGHNVLRYGKLTKWAKANPGQAAKLAKERVKSEFAVVAQLGEKAVKLLANLKAPARSPVVKPVAKPTQAAATA